MKNGAPRAKPVVPCFTPTRKIWRNSLRQFRHTRRGYPPTDCEGLCPLANIRRSKSFFAFIHGQSPWSSAKADKLTEFQWQVLAATATIPLGETRSYKWVAQQVGRPHAVRAVGQALKRNPFPIIIPCHRVIKKDGSLGGYAGCSDRRKAQLLKMEHAIVSQPSFLLNSRKRKGKIKNQ